MVCREQKGAAMYKKLKLLRSVTHSHAQSKSSIILDASKYIQELKHKVERNNQELAQSQHFTPQTLSPTQLRVEAKENGFVIKVSSGRSCSGLLVFILEAFEELGLDVLQARVSCSDHFYLEAIGAKDKAGAETIDAQVVKQAVLQAIQNWSKVTHEN